MVHVHSHTKEQKLNLNNPDIFHPSYYYNLVLAPFFLTPSTQHKHSNTQVIPLPISSISDPVDKVSNNLENISRLIWLGNWERGATFLISFPLLTFRRSFTKILFLRTALQGARARDNQILFSFLCLKTLILLVFYKLVLSFHVDHWMRGTVLKTHHLLRWVSFVPDQYLIWRSCNFFFLEQLQLELELLDVLLQYLYPFLLSYSPYKNEKKELHDFIINMIFHWLYYVYRVYNV